jgi:Lon protease-like protein
MFLYVAPAGERFMTEERIIPLFPLGIVALPGAPVPLHIFEERYKEMIGRCLDESIEFGIVWYSGEEGLRNQGGTVRILQVIRRYDDGRMDILTRGERRFRILEIFEDKPYLEGRVAFFDDAPEAGSQEFLQLAEKGRAVFEELGELLTAQSGVDGIDLSDPKRLSFVIAGFEGFGAGEKQAFLEMTSTRRRLAKGVAALEKVTRRLRLTREIERIIGGNGHPPEQLRHLVGETGPSNG